MQCTPQTTDNITATYDSGEDTTKFTLPYTMQGKTFAIVRPDETKNKGLILGLRSGKHEITCTSGVTGQLRISFGRVFKFEYEFNKAHKPSTRSGQAAIDW